MTTREDPGYELPGYSDEEVDHIVSTVTDEAVRTLVTDMLTEIKMCHQFADHVSDMIAL